MTPKLPNEPDLYDVASRVAFSYESLAHAANWLRINPEADLDISNAVVDSFVVHARRLLKFLVPDKNPRADDLLVHHVVKNPPSFELEATLTNLPRINRRILHLTTETDPEPVTWHVSIMHAEIKGAMEILIAQMEIESAAMLPRFSESLDGNPTFRKVIVV